MMLLVQGLLALCTTFTYYNAAKREYENAHKQAYTKLIFLATVHSSWYAMSKCATDVRDNNN